MNPSQTDVVIIGASAAGLMCAIEAAQRDRKVVVLDHANKAGKKILMSGGGRCNFTNINVSVDNFISHNPHFCKSAISRYTPWHFIALVNGYNIPYNERHHGQLFCDDGSKDILNMLLSECKRVGVYIRLNCTIKNAHKPNESYIIKTSSGDYTAESLVIATGGLSIPKMGATGFGYNIGKRFGHTIRPTTTGLVPFTLQPDDKAWLADLSGIAIECVVQK